VKKIRENNQKAKTTYRIINQMISPRLKHNKIQAQWTIDILSKKHVGKGMMV